MRHEIQQYGNGEQRFLASLSRPVPEAYREVINKISLFSTSSRFAQSFEMLSFLDNDNLTSKGRQLAALLAGGEIIDLGCGITHWAEKDVAEVAKRLGAQRYVGVDYDRVGFEGDKEGTYTYSDKDDEGGAFEKIFVRDDMLSYVSKINGRLSGGPRVFYLSGLQAAPTEGGRDYIVEDYFDKLWREMQRVTKPGDAVVLNNCYCSPPQQAGGAWKDIFLRYNFKFEPVNETEREEVSSSGPHRNYNIVFVRI